MKTFARISLLGGILVFILSNFGCALPGSKSPPLRSNLVGFWSGENSGKDSVNGNNATLTDVTFANSKMGRAFSFNGISSCMKIPASRALDIGTDDSFTIMAWIKPLDISGLHPLIQWSDKNMLNMWIGIRPYESGVLRGDLTDEDGNHFLVSNPDTLANDSFQHIAFTYDKANGTGTLYVNGIIVAQRLLGRDLIANTRGDLWISQPDHRPNNWSTGRMFSGLMNNIAIYNRALSASEVQSICIKENHNKPLATPTPSSGWFDANWMR